VRTVGRLVVARLPTAGADDSNLGWSAAGDRWRFTETGADRGFTLLMGAALLAIVRSSSPTWEGRRRIG
jgi:hypothetical protein